MDIRGNDAAHSEISTLSETSSRTEHMGYLMTVLGMDQVSASLLYRAERLQEKGELRQALKYYERVLEKFPGCGEVTENIRMVKELLVEEDKKSRQKRLAPIPEEKRERSPSQPVVTEMDVDWYGRENFQLNFYPDPDDCAVAAANRKLLLAGYGASLLKLIENTTLTDTCDHETGWETFMSGRARFQVTLIPDHEPNQKLVDSIMTELLFRKEERDKDNGGGHRNPTADNSSIRFGRADATPCSVQEDEEDDDSRFADAAESRAQK